MKNYSVKKLVLNGLMIALVFIATYFTRIPTPLPGGYFNLGDAVIMLAAVFLGPVGGLVAGAIGSSLADLAFGSLLFAPITLVVKGLEGLIIGLIALKYKQKTDNRQGNSAAFHYRLILALFTGAVVMVLGYFCAEAFILSFFDEAFGWLAAVTELLPNSIQGGLSAVLGYILVMLLSKMNIDKYFE